MLLVYAVIAGLLCWIISSGAPMWSRWSLYFGAPIIAGAFWGLVLGDLGYGLEVGATIMMAYLGLVAIGGSIPSDLALAGYLGVLMTMLSGADASVGLAIAVPLGVLGSLCSTAKMSLNPIWVHIADKYAAKGDTRGVILMNRVGSQVFPFLTYFIPVFLCVYFGAPVLETLMNNIPAKLLTILSLMGHIIPALGLGMLFNSIYKKSILPYLLIGFVFASYFGANTMSLAILGVAGGLLHLYFKKKEEAA